MDYYNKYLKYKNKYINLKKIYNNDKIKETSTNIVTTNKTTYIYKPHCTYNLPYLNVLIARNLIHCLNLLFSLTS